MILTSAYTSGTGCMQWCDTLSTSVFVLGKTTNYKSLVWSKQKLEKKAINRTVIARSWRSLTNEACVDSHEYMYLIVRHTVTVKAKPVTWNLDSCSWYNLWRRTNVDIGKNSFENFCAGLEIFFYIPVKLLKHKPNKQNNCLSYIYTFNVFLHFLVH